MSETREHKIHQGRNVKRFREMRGLKQEGLAMELGEDWTQRRVSLLEGKEEIEPEILEQVARALKLPVEAFTDLDEDSAFNIISNTFHNNSHDHSSLVDLTERNNAMYSRYLDGLSWAEIAAEFKLSKDRVKQICARVAVKKEKEARRRQKEE